MWRVRVSVRRRPHLADGPCGAAAAGGPGGRAGAGVAGRRGGTVSGSVCGAAPRDPLAKPGEGRWVTRGGVVLTVNGDRDEVERQLAGGELAWTSRTTGWPRGRRRRSIRNLSKASRSRCWAVLWSQCSQISGRSAGMPALRYRASRGRGRTDLADKASAGELELTRRITPTSTTFSHRSVPAADPTMLGQPRRPLRS
jgi:hypothetical protein